MNNVKTSKLKLLQEFDDQAADIQNDIQKALSDHIIYDSSPKNSIASQNYEYIKNKLKPKNYDYDDLHPDVVFTIMHQVVEELERQ